MTATALKVLLGKKQRQHDAPRYPDGTPYRHRRIKDSRTLSTWQRMRRNAEDPQSEHWLGHYFFSGKLTDSHVETGFDIARIYSNLERLREQERRNPKSPSYQPSFGIAPSIYDTGTPEQIAEHNEKLAEAEADYGTLTKCYPNQIAREVVEQLCVDNHTINHRLFDDLGKLLNYITKELATDREKRARLKAAAEARQKAAET